MMNLFSRKSPTSQNSLSLGLLLTFVLVLLVIVSISPHLASAEVDKCSNPGSKLANFTPEKPPRLSPVYPFFDAQDGELSIADYKGQGVVLNFWATWCVPCIKEMPSLARLKELLSTDNITVLALSQDRGGAKKVIPFLKKLGIEGLDALIDKKGTVARKSGVRGLPLTILVDAEGFERGRLIGIAEWDSPQVVAFVRRCIGPRSSF